MIKNNKGVTLVELLIVIVILGIIAAISIPAVGSIVENANKDAVISEALNLRSQANLYCATNSDECDGETYLASSELSQYIEIDTTSYSVYRPSSTASWEVFIEINDYYFGGNPTGASRENVKSAGETTSSSWSATTTPPPPTTTP